MTWIVTLRGRRGTYGTGLALVARLVPRRRWDAAAFCVACVALCDIDLCVAGVALHPRRRWDAAAFCVAGVALCDIDLHFVWQAWHAGVALCDIDLHFVWQAWHFMTWIGTLRGRRGS